MLYENRDVYSYSPTDTEMLGLGAIGGFPLFMVVTSAFVGERPPGVVEIELSVCQFLSPGIRVREKSVSEDFHAFPREIRGEEKKLSLESR